MNLVPIDEVADTIVKLFKGKQLLSPDNFKVVHHFSDGVCVRELHVKAGQLIVGTKHLTNHLTFLSKGVMQIRIDDESKLYKAPCTFETLAGSRKIGLAYTDCVVSNIIPTDLTDIREIEDMFTTLHQERKEIGWEE